jgi:two-component system, cell cycle response regulator
MPKQHLRRRNDEQAGETTPLRALVVDDSEPYRSYVTSLVTGFGFEVDECVDGAEALGALTRGPRYDLLIIDFEMPRISGLQLITAVRKNDLHSDVYAIMLTGRDDLDTKVAALRLGFDDFIAKSATELEMVAKLSAARRLVSRQRRLDETVHELYGLATRDELTGLFNRRFFFLEAERMLSEGSPINLVFFDLDDFKHINDTLGHLAGDRILRDIGSLFLSRTRNEDLIARYGGDEFVMLVPDLEPAEMAFLASRIAAEIAQSQWTFGTETFTVDVTTGIACSSLLNKPSVAQLLSAGDRDLYKNKWVRKNPNEDPEMYRYDHGREGRVLELGPTEAKPALRVKNEE